jgi:DNA-binding GntR family transcriptional regulator
MADQTLPAQIADQLRRDILRGVLRPGMSIKERDNADKLGVSRTPLREAIRILATEGLVELRPARSPIVSIPSVKQIEDEVEVLLAVEKMSGELACVRASDAEIDALAAIVDVMADNFDTADAVEMFEIDMSFHSSLARASHNEPLAEIHGTFLSRLWRSRFLSAIQRRNRERVVDHHGQIVAALRARDAAATRAAIGVHLDRLAKDIIFVITQEIEQATADADRKEDNETATLRTSRLGKGRDS